MKIKDVMSTPVVAVPGMTTAREVAQHMDHSGVGCVIVTDGRDVIGIVTDRDLVLRVLARGRSADTPIVEAMTTKPVGVRPDDDLDVAFETLRRHAIRRLPVVEGDTVLGMVTLDDLLVHNHELTGSLLRPVLSEISFPQH
ncbi:CBS domain-containing protein [Nonomuraea soli]|uniref:Signal-transduction protein with cAMP-binding, CBS, and nucleotidyltransferase domain n=1 Tax=Nonomuraea soli TaxID=1032476 RepID=A0A7W0CF06_9ACTN|nr:CBS domain-containing protein [Nonomuraea soli]MBA2889978.1 signal-transduction protein with cAMP-binding, CBS, and nucleotidyltransferase domain [Nonomuraea soli]